MQAVILAAGRGTRLGSLARGRSKAMMPVLGRPLVERVIAPLVAHGIRDLVFVIAPDDERLRAHFAAAAPEGGSVRFVVQQERRGMAHALALAAPFVADRFVLTACDSLVPAGHVTELLRAFEGADGVLSLLDVAPEAVSRSAPVVLDGARVVRIVEKPRAEEAPSHTVSLPLYLFDRRLLELLPRLRPSVRGELELQEAIQMLVDDGAHVIGVRASERLQVTSADDLLRLNLRLLRSGDEPALVAPDAVGEGTALLGPLRIEPGVTIGAGATIGPEVYVECGAVLGDGVVVERALVLAGSRVADGERLSGVVVGAPGVAESPTAPLPTEPGDPGRTR